MPVIHKVAERVEQAIRHICDSGQGWGTVTVEVKRRRQIRIRIETSEDVETVEAADLVVGDTDPGKSWGKD